MQPIKIGNGKWLFVDRKSIRFNVLVRNPKVTLITWISLFLAFGPLQILIHNTSYKGAVIFGHNPFAYFIAQGLFIATFTIGVIYLLNSIIKRKTLRMNIRVKRKKQ